ncbi:MAG: ATP-binding protein [Campylobacterota bacterium]|nr:ATP-binding protein [Campylobacterota bacterium]
MTIKNKLLVNILLIVLFGSGILVVEYINKTTTTTMQENHEIFDNITISSFKLSLLSRELAQYPDEIRPNIQWKSEYNAIYYHIENIPLDKKEISKDYKKLIYSYKKLLVSYNEIKKTIKEFKSGKIKQNIYKKRIERINTNICVETQNIVSSGTLLWYESKENFNKSLEKLRITTILIVIVMIIVVVAFALYIARGMISSLNNLNEGALKVTSGELNYRVSEDSKDELGKFAKSFNYMLSKLSQTMMSNDKLELIINERTDELKKSRLAAISIMEDANHQKELVNKVNAELQEEIKIREKTQIELEKAKKDAEYANKSKSIFLANMAHELRTPLNAIMGFSELLRKNKSILPEQKETLDIIHRSGDHLLKLINDVLDLAKIEAGRIPIEKEAFDLGNLINESLDLMGQRAESKGLKIELDQTSDFPRYIFSDQGKIRQIIINFLSNAVKYTNEGGIKVMLEVEDNYLHIEVSDSGVGIKEEDIDKVFDPFTQVGSSSSKTGTGLGLTITKQFIELLGGTVGLESKVGEGSSFWAKIPFEKTSKEDVVSVIKEEEKEIIGLDQAQQDIKILIVEDQPENRLLLMSLLKILGLQVKEAVNGQEAVDIFKQWNPDFIWMDRRMPVMNGEKATQLIRELPNGDKTIIVALTASAFHEERKKMIDAGMDDFLAKPYRQNQIYDMMKKHLNLNYIYKEFEKKEIKDIPKYTDDELKKMIEKLDSELLKELYKNVILLDSESIKPTLDKINNIDKELSRVLGLIIENYDFGRIIKLLQTIKEGQDGE